MFMKASLAVVLPMMALASLSPQAWAADECPKEGASDWCCRQERPAAAPSEQNYRWHEDSQLCEGLISPRHSVSELELVDFVATPVPTDRDLSDLAQPIAISLGAPATPLGGPIRLKGMSLKGGAYLVAGDVPPGIAKSWDVSQFRKNASMRTFGFIAYLPPAPAQGRRRIHLPLHMVLPGATAAQGSAARVRFLSGRALAEASANFRPLEADMEAVPGIGETPLPTTMVSREIVEVTIPEGMPARFEILVRACARSEKRCDITAAAPVGFDVVSAP